jgi:hypothetical protein
VPAIAIQVFSTAHFTEFLKIVLIFTKQPSQHVISKAVKKISPVSNISHSMQSHFAESFALSWKVNV